MLCIYALEEHSDSILRSEENRYTSMFLLKLVSISEISAYEEDHGVKCV
jgi:hypothetical protein